MTADIKPSPGTHAATAALLLLSRCSPAAPAPVSAEADAGLGSGRFGCSTTSSCTLRCARLPSTDFPRLGPHVTYACARTRGVYYDAPSLARVMPNT